MIVEIKVPSPGESINEVEIASWMVADGDIVEKDQEIAEIESDKATLALIAAESGKISIVVPAGESIKVAGVACTIDTTFAKAVVSKNKNISEINEPTQLLQPEKAPKQERQLENADKIKVSPVAQKIMDEEGLAVEDIINGLKRITSREVERVKELGGKVSSGAEIRSKPPVRDIQKQKVSQLRKKISKRLVAVKNETAMLTTFNEVDMTEVIALRKKYQQAFVEKHGVKAGFMSFFIKAAANALQYHPMVNSMLDGEEILTPQYIDVSVAVQTPKGLLVPVIRNVETLGLAQIELHLKELAIKARSGKIALEEMQGGTFTITNGGVFGSMLSTPLINPPQSAILGMHNIVERPVAINGNVEIRPIMYLALSYDHRLIDGKDSVGCLVKIKEMLENPSKLLLGGENPELLLMDL